MAANVIDSTLEFGVVVFAGANGVEMSNDDVVLSAISVDFDSLAAFSWSLAITGIVVDTQKYTKLAAIVRNNFVDSLAFAIVNNLRLLVTVGCFWLKFVLSLRCRFGACTITTHTQHPRH